MIPEVFTIQQAARYLQLDSEVLLRKIKAGMVPAAKIAGEWRLRRARKDAITFQTGCRGYKRSSQRRLVP